MTTIAEAYEREGLTPPSTRVDPKGEHVLQIACKQWLSEALPPEVVWTAVDHGSYLGGGLNPAYACGRGSSRAA